MEEVSRHPSGALLMKELSLFVFCNNFCKKELRTVKRWEMKSWEAQRLLWAAQPSHLLYKCRKLRIKRDFFPVRLKSNIVRRTISLYNKELWFACWRKMGEISKCYAVDGGKMNYFVFPAFFPLTVRSF